MKKMSIMLLLAIVLIISGCSGETKPDKTSFPDGGLLVTIGGDKHEFYIDASVSRDSTYFFKIIKFDGIKITTDDIVNTYEYRNDEELKELLNKFNLQLEGVN